MKVKFFAVILVVAAVFSATAAKKPKPVDPITVKQTADKITITGARGKKITSEKFALSKDGWYIVKISYTGPAVSTCQLSLATQAMVTAKDTIGGLLTNWMGPSTAELIKHKGIMKSEDYMIYVDDAEGPWTIEILKSPKPAPVSTATTFSGTSDKVTPFFHLKKGPAKFTMNQKPKGKFSARLWVILINADTGSFVTELCHNAEEPTLKAKADIPAAGNYILQVAGGNSWDVSFTQ